MKRFLFLLSFFVLAIGASPQAGFAFSEQELSDFLNNEEITEEQLNDHLSLYYELSMDDFETIEELDIFLGDKITNENLQELLEINNLANEDELVSLLVEKGEMEQGQDVRQVFIYIDTLYWIVSNYSGTPISDENLQQLLDDYGLTIDELNQIFNTNQDSLENYEFIEDVEMAIWTYGVPVTEQTLQNLLNDYGLTLEQVKSILEENGDSLENYQTIDELGSALFTYGIPITDQGLQGLLESFELSSEQLDALLAKYDDSLLNYNTIDKLYISVGMYSMLEESDQFLEELAIGLDKEELKNLVKHFLSIDLTDPVFEEKMLELENRIGLIGELDQIDSPDDLTPEQINELTGVFKEMMDLYGLDLKFYLVKENEKIALSEDQLVSMDGSTNDNLMIEFYNKQGVLLADILLTPELFGLDFIEEITDKIGEIEENLEGDVNIPPVVKEENPSQKTENPQVEQKITIAANTDASVNKAVEMANGNKLPDTATNYGNGMLAGLGLILIGLVIFRKRALKSTR